MNAAIKQIAGKHQMKECPSYSEPGLVECTAHTSVHLKASKGSSKRLQVEK